ncbi:hypothetical protein [Streptomyces sp. DH24]|uniref:hypothetical protein n=1 Tax=Streptomyces sp. DH24 TaxID=3040123 RepID=UPI002441F1BC|nr:hypothetical protein [Streptomyces sp. DH24]MDG9717180.1 hypothetical protein [Streptomyces sp. DH24]
MTHTTGLTGGNDRDARGESPLGTPARPTDRETGTWTETEPEAAPAPGTDARAGTAPGAARASETATAAKSRADTGTGAPGSRDTAATTGSTTGTGEARAGTGNRLLPQDESDRLALRMQQAVTGFVDGPRGAVEEADHVLEDIAARFTEAMTNRRRGLRASWRGDGTATGSETAGDTEQLRLALRDYRELAERLLRV